MDMTFEPRPYQLAALKRLHEGAKRNVWVWHRRSGKDMTAWNWMIYQALTVVGGYYYFLPTYKQAERVIWHNFTKDGKRFLDFIPREAIKGKPNDTDLRVQLVNGSIIQLISADNFDGNVGASFKGAVFSEYSVMDERGWRYMSPIAVESGAWVIFVFTPRGDNHGYKMHLDALREIDSGNQRWAHFLYTVDDTQSLSRDDLEEERRNTPEALYLQEFYCRFDVANTGTVFGTQVENARREGRVCKVPYDPSLPVHTAWDLGVADPTAVWMFQRDYQSTRFIEYYEQARGGLEDHVNYLRTKPYVYGTHFWPHDMMVKEFGSGRTRLDTACDLGLRDGVVVPKWAKEEQFHAGRNLLPRSYFDEAKCELGISKLGKYGFNFNEGTGEYSKQPKDNQNSHAADAFMVGAVAHDLGYVENDFVDDPDEQLQVIGTFGNKQDPFKSSIRTDFSRFYADRG